MIVLLVIFTLLVGSALGGFYLLNNYNGHSNLNYDFVLDDENKKKELTINYHKLNSFSVLVNPEPERIVKSVPSEKWEDIFNYKERRDGYSYCKTIHLKGNYKKVIIRFWGDYNHWRECGGLKINNNWIVRAWSCNFVRNGPVERDITNLVKANNNRIDYCVYANYEVSNSYIQIRGLKVENEKLVIYDYPVLKIYKDGELIFNKKITNKEVIDLTKLATFSLFDSLKYDKEAKIVFVKEGKGKLAIKTDVSVSDKFSVYIDKIKGVFNGKDN